MSLLARIMRRIAARPDAGAPPRLPSPDALVLVAQPYGEPEAQLFHDMLQNEGVRSMIKNRDPVSARAGGIGPPWSYELWVLRRDLLRAREILGVEQGDAP